MPVHQAMIQGDDFLAFFRGYGKALQGRSRTECGDAGMDHQIAVTAAVGIGHVGGCRRSNGSVSTMVHSGRATLFFSIRGYVDNAGRNHW